MLLERGIGKCPTNCDAHPGESNFQTHSGKVERTGNKMLKIKKIKNDHVYVDTPIFLPYYMSISDMSYLDISTGDISR